MTPRGMDSRDSTCGRSRKRVLGTNASAGSLSKQYPEPQQGLIETYVRAALDARVKQGLPRYVQDLGVLDKIATLLVPAERTNETFNKKPAA